MQVARKIVRHCDALHDGVHGEMVFVPKELECVATRQEIAYPRINRAICPSYKSNKLNEAVLIIHRADGWRRSVSTSSTLTWAGCGSIAVIPHPPDLL
jgi:hypothetical protein